MLDSILSKVKLLITIAAFVGVVWLVLQGRSVQSLTFLSPPPPTPVHHCDAPQIVCREGGTKGFGPFTISFPNGFYLEKVRVNCDFGEASRVPPRPLGLSPVDRPVFCYFGDLSTANPVEPVIAFQQPIYVIVEIPSSQASHIALYMYQSSGWTRMSRNVPVGEGTVTFSLDRLYPVGPENLNYFWLFEAQASTPTPMPMPTATPGLPTSTSTPATTPIGPPTPIPIPTKSSTLTPTDTPTLTSTPADISTNVPILTSTLTFSVGSTGKTLFLVCGGVIVIIGVAFWVILTRRRA